MSSMSASTSTATAAELVSPASLIQVPTNSIPLESNSSVATGVEESLGFTILQCQSCRSIIGDTSSLLILNRETLLITLHKKSDNVIIDCELETSKGEFDYGSTFNNLHCKNCNEWVGRTYLTTTPELDNIRGRFSFNLGSLIMFELKDIEQAKIITDDQGSLRVGSNVDQIEIIKLQKFVLALYDRLEKLEAENEILKLKLELLSISKKKENNSDETLKSLVSSGFGSGTLPKQTKLRKIRTQRESETLSQETQIPSTYKTVLPIKAIAASINSTDFIYKSPMEQQKILSNLDEETALETISWSILKNNRIAQIQREIDF